MAEEFAVLQQAPDPNAQENCVVEDLPNEEYHAARGVSKSDLSEILDWTPAHWRAWKEAPWKETEAMKIGTALHAAVLEPERFARVYAVEPEVNKRTNAGKEALREAAAGGRILLEPDQMRDVLGMRESVLSLHAVQVLMSSGRPEVSMFAHLPDFHPLRGKARPDWLNPDMSAMMDLKTTTDARPKEFGKTVFEHHYEMQPPHYGRVYNLLTGDVLRLFVFIAVEKKPPYAVAPYILSNPAIEYGRHECRNALELFRKCVVEDSWPAYPTDVGTIGLPKWALAAGF